MKEHCDEEDPTLLIDPSRIYGSNKKEFTFNTKGRKVVAFRELKNVCSWNSSVKTQVTVLASMNASGHVLASMSASGHYLPPLFIYPYTRIQSKILLNGFPDAELQVSDNGCITAAIFNTWLKDSFIPRTASIKKPLVLFVDGHTSHTSLIETFEISEENQIILYCLPPHTSPLMQPLDQAFYGVVKPAWAEAARRHIAVTGDDVGLDSFAQVMQPIWSKASTLKIAQQSFKAAGIVPFDPESVLNSGKMCPCTEFKPATAATTLYALPTMSFAEVLASTTVDTKSAPSTSYHHELPGPRAADMIVLPSTSYKELVDSATKDTMTVSSLLSTSGLVSEEEPLDPKQLEALGNLMISCYDEVSRNQFLCYFSSLTGSVKQPERDADYVKFKSLPSTLLRKCTMPTLQCVISGHESEACTKKKNNVKRRKRIFTNCRGR